MFQKDALTTAGDCLRFEAGFDHLNGDDVSYPCTSEAC